MCLLKKQQQAAFGLCELLIALAIMSVMLLSMTLLQSRALLLARSTAKQAENLALLAKKIGQANEWI